MYRISLYLLLCLFTCKQVTAYPIFFKTEVAAPKEKKKKKKGGETPTVNPAVEAANNQVAQMEMKLERLEQELEKANNQIAVLEEQNERMKEQFSAAATEAKEQKMRPGSKGLAFKVQLGAYKSFSASAQFNDKSLDTENDGTDKYVIGYFISLDEAKSFEKDVKKLGIRDAWIVPYMDGNRISDEQAEQVLGYSIREKK